ETEVVVPGGESAADVARETLAPSAAPKREGEVRSLEDGAEFGAALARRTEAQPTERAVEALEARAGADGLRLRAARQGGALRLADGGGQVVATLEVGQWSDWQFGRFVGREGVVRASCRFKLLSLDGQRARLLRSEVYP